MKTHICPQKLIGAFCTISPWQDQGLSHLGFIQLQNLLSVSSQHIVFNHRSTKGHGLGTTSSTTLYQAYQVCIN